MRYIIYKDAPAQKISQHPFYAIDDTGYSVDVYYNSNTLQGFEKGFKGLKAQFYQNGLLLTPSVYSDKNQINQDYYFFNNKGEEVFHIRKKTDKTTHAPIEDILINIGTLFITVTRTNLLTNQTKQEIYNVENLNIKKIEDLDQISMFDL